MQDIYQRLMDTYGPQHWWPADEPFEVMVGAILTQSAAWRNVEKAITNLKAAGALSPEALRRLSVSEIAELIHPCGYYNTKARKLKALAEWLKERCQDDIGKMSAMPTDRLREQLLSVWGVGEETADSIILYAANQPVFVIDAYTRRIIDRVGLTPEGLAGGFPSATRRTSRTRPYSAYQALFMDNLPFDRAQDKPFGGVYAERSERAQGKPADVRLFNEYHALLVCLGKNVCRKEQPLCQRCCLKDMCHSSTSPLLFPSPSTERG